MVRGLGGVFTQPLTKADLMCQEPNRQAGKEESGVILPEGMTPECLDELASFLNDYAGD